MVLASCLIYHQRQWSPLVLETCHEDSGVNMSHGRLTAGTQQPVCGDHHCQHCPFSGHMRSVTGKVRRSKPGTRRAILSSASPGLVFSGITDRVAWRALWKALTAGWCWTPCQEQEGGRGVSHMTFSKWSSFGSSGGISVPSDKMEGPADPTELGCRAAYLL